MKRRRFITLAILPLLILYQYVNCLGLLSFSDQLSPLLRRVKFVDLPSLDPPLLRWDEHTIGEFKRILEGLSNGVSPLSTYFGGQDLASGELSQQAEIIENLVVSTLGWDKLSSEQQAKLLWVCQELIEQVINMNLKYSLGSMQDKDIATSALVDILKNIKGLISQLEKLCGKKLDINDPVAVSIIVPWIMIATQYQVINRTSVEETMAYIIRTIEMVDLLGMDVDLNNPVEVGQVVGFVDILSIAEQLPVGYEGLVGNVVNWSVLYQVPRAQLLNLAQGAIAHKAIVEKALATIGQSNDIEHVVPWLNVAMDRAIRENISIETAIQDVATMITFMQGSGVTAITANISEELGRPFDWTSGEDVALMAASIEAILELNSLIPGGPITTDPGRRSRWSFSPRTFALLRDVLTLIYAGVNFSNYFAGASSAAHVIADSALLFLIFRPIVDMGLEVLQRLFHGLVLPEATSLSMGDEPKKSFYAQFFGRLPEWIQGNLIFLKDEWLPRTSLYRLLQLIKAEMSMPEAATAGKRTFTNILRAAYIPPLFDIYIIQKIAGAAAHTLVPASPTLAAIMSFISILGCIVFMGKILSPYVSKKYSFSDRSPTSLIAGFADGILELLVSTPLLMPLLYYMPLFHLRALRQIRQDKLEGKVPVRTPGWLVNELWQVDSLAESYRKQAPTVGIGTLMGTGLMLFNPVVGLLSMPIWGSLLISPWLAYKMEPKP